MAVTRFDKVSDTTTKVYATCDLDGEENDMTFAMSFDDFCNAFDRWRNGTLIQNAFPTLNPDEREFLMTGITPEKWNDIFG